MSRRKIGKTTQKVLAFILSVSLVLGGIPLTAKAAPASTNSKITDPSTIHQWQDYFTDTSTEFAGAVTSNLDNRFLN